MTPPSPEEVAKQARARMLRREEAMATFLKEFYKQGPGRPDAAGRALKVQVAALIRVSECVCVSPFQFVLPVPLCVCLQMYANDDTSTLAPPAWMEGPGLEACRQNSWQHPRLPVVQSLAPTPPVPVDLDPGSDGEKKEVGAAAEKAPGHYAYRNAVVKTLLRALLHRWDDRGRHVGWMDIKQYVKKIQDDLGHTVSLPTAYRYLKSEQKAFDSNSPEAITRRPNLIDLLTEAKDILGSGPCHREGDAAPEDGHHIGRPFTFLKEWYKKLREDCLPLKDITGFGVPTVRALAVDIYLAEMGDSTEEVWEPSDSWCLSFLKNHLGLTRRRVTGSMIPPSQRDVQERLHNSNIRRIAFLLAEGLDPKYIIGADEFGCHYFPQSKYKWEELGSKRILGDVGDDKRQYTGAVLVCRMLRCCAVL